MRVLLRRQSNDFRNRYQLKTIESSRVVDDCKPTANQHKKHIGENLNDFLQQSFAHIYIIRIGNEYNNNEV